MRMFKRWVSCLTTNFDWVITQVENHEALVDGAIREMQGAGQKARVQLARVQKDGELMRERLVQLKQQEQIWTERALRISTEDDDKALECVRRRRVIQQEISQLDKQASEHLKLETQLHADLKKLTLRIDELKRKKNAYTARQYRADAIRAGNTEDITLITEIGDIFERWDSRIIECETIAAPAEDKFEIDLKNEEEQVALRLELAELRGTHAAGDQSRVE